MRSYYVMYLYILTRSDTESKIFRNTAFPTSKSRCRERLDKSFACDVPNSHLNAHLGAVFALAPTFVSSLSSWHVAN